MKYIFTIIFTATTFLIFAQEFPSVTIKDGNANEFLTKQIIEESKEKPIVVSFWATWCVSCINELSAINDNLVDWQEEVDFNLYAVSIDDSRASKKALALANGKSWEFNVLLDMNQELKRKLNISNIPYLVIIKDGEIVYTKVSYTKGSEVEILEKLQNL